MGQILLIAVLLVPVIAIGGIVAARRQQNIREAISLIASALVFAAVVVLYQKVMAGEHIGLNILEILPGIHLAFYIEPLGLVFALIASSLWFVTLVYAIGYMRGHHEKNQTRFYSLFALAIAAVMGIAFAENLFTLFVFYEVLTLSTYPLVTHAGTDKAKQGGRTYLGILLATSIIFFLTGIVATWVTAGTLSFTAGGIFNAEHSSIVVSIILVLFVFGIGKAAMMPFHRWLPAAMVAPTPVSALLHAVAVVKAGVFSLLKVCVLLFGFDTLKSLPVTQFLLYFAAFSALVASLIALRQENLKARLAYSTVSQLAYVSVGALLASKTGAIGSVLHIAMHAFGKITLFFCAGAILVAHHKTEVRELVGIGRRMPITMTAFFIGSLCIIGLPPTGGTWSKWYLLTGTLEAGDWPIMLMLLLGSLLSLGYLLPIVARAFFPEGNSAMYSKSDWRWSDIEEAPWPSLLAIVITATMCVLLFIFPEFIYSLAHTGILDT